LQWIVTGDETWMHLCEPTKRKVETHVVAQDQVIQKCAFCWQSNVNAIMELSTGLSSNTTRIVDRQSGSAHSAQYCAMCYS